MKRTTISALMFLVMMACLAATAVPTMADVIKWRYQSCYNVKSLSYRQPKFWAEEIERRSKGRIKFQIYSQNQMFKLKGALSAVRSRVVEAMSVGFSHFSGEIREANVEWLPCSWNYEQYKKIYLKTEYLNVLNQAIEKYNIRYAFPTATGTYPLISKKKVNSLNDLKGFLLRSATGIEAKFLRSFGITAIPVSGAEIYTALQRGTIDGLWWPYSAMNTYNLWEPCSYVVNLHLHQPGLTGTIVNLDAYNALPDDIRTIMDDVSREMITRTVVDCQNYDKEVIAKAKSKGMTFITLPEEMVKEWQERAIPFWDDAAKLTPSSKQLVDIVKSVVLAK